MADDANPLKISDLNMLSQSVQISHSQPLASLKSHDVETKEKSKQTDS